MYRGRLAAPSASGRQRAAAAAAGLVVLDGVVELAVVVHLVPEPVLVYAAALGGPGVEHLLHEHAGRVVDGRP